MLRDVLPSTITAMFAGPLAAAFLGIAAGNAAPVNCPDGIGKFNPANGDLFVASAQNELQRIRAEHGAVEQPITLNPDAHISFYYFVKPRSLTTPMVFALVRAYKIRPGFSTSLDPDEVRVSNSNSRGEAVPTKKYAYFHEEKRLGFNVLRQDFHMWFHDGFFSSSSNSYDDLDDPDVYALPEGNGFNGYKARMQRIKGFTSDGRCVVFDLFRHKRFAQALESFSLSLIALADKRSRADDLLRFSIGFAATP
jgi:hypothetical protein